MRPRPGVQVHGAAGGCIDSGGERRERQGSEGHAEEQQHAEDVHARAPCGATPVPVLPRTVLAVLAGPVLNGALLPAVALPPAVDGVSSVGCCCFARPVRLNARANAPVMMGDSAPSVSSAERLASLALGAASPAPAEGGGAGGSLSRSIKRLGAASTAEEGDAREYSARARRGTAARRSERAHLAAPHWLLRFHHFQGVVAVHCRRLGSRHYCLWQRRQRPRRRSQGGEHQRQAPCQRCLWHQRLLARGLLMTSRPWQRKNWKETELHGARGVRRETWMQQCGQRRAGNGAVHTHLALPHVLLRFQHYLGRIEWRCCHLGSRYCCLRQWTRTSPDPCHCLRQRRRRRPRRRRRRRRRRQGGRHPGHDPC
jgi:hypothetical protein